MTALGFEKYHGFGNDFLITLEPPACDLGQGFIAAVCDRRRGLGADGVILGHLADPASGSRGHVVMELRNADGTAAETSGNGLRCLGLAVIDAGLADGPEVVVGTVAGLRRVRLTQRLDHSSALLSAEMGTLVVGAREQSGPLLKEIEVLLGTDHGFAVYTVDAGNPHLVLIGQALNALDMSTLGRTLEQVRPGGQNVEVVAPPGRDRLRMLVWERGAGLTDACGSGSCAVAAVARGMGLVGDDVEVENPGGTLVVELAGDPSEPRASLTGPATRVARVEICSGFGLP